MRYKRTVGSEFDFKSNSFGFIRFFLAMLVMFGHTYGLGGFGKDPIKIILRGQESSGTLAVYGFFLISGFLVTRSMLSSSNLFAYGLKRALRILPGFWVCLIVTAFVFAPLVYFFEHQSLIGYLAYNPTNPIHYVRTNFFLLMHEYSIAGLLSSNPVPYVFDGSLWTLFLEAKTYVMLAIIGVVGLTYKKKYIMLGIFLILWGLILFTFQVTDSPNKFLRLIIDRSFLLYATYFACGSVFFLFKDKIPFSKYIFLTSILVFIIGLSLGFLHQTLPIVWPIILLWLALKLPFKHFADLGDFSYGIYIYAFPIQQMASFFHLNREINTYFLLCFGFTMTLAMASWFLIEKPALKLKKITYFKRLYQWKMIKLLVTKPFL